MFPLAFLLVVAGFAFASVDALCPEFLRNQKACTCTDYVDGAIIKCSGPEGPLVVEELKKAHAEVRELSLENANIVEIGSRAFKNLRIKKLVLDNNRIISIQKDAFRGLESVLQELSINHNRLAEVPSEALQGLRALNALSLRCNEIGNLTDVVFQNMPSLIEVNLACNKICKIDGSAFVGVKSTLQNLILDNNCLHYMPTLAVDGMQFLIALHIKYNKIEKLGKNDLRNLTSLSMLTLTGNSIAQISKKFVDNTPNLRYIYLGENALTAIEPGTMKQLAQAEIIDLSYNNLPEITVDMFSGMENLQHLNLEANAIKDVAPGAFATTPLLLLWLPHNCISAVSPNMFQGTPFLKQVSLAHNNIRTVQPFSFAHLANLHTLDLSNNKIQSLQTSAIMGSDFLTVRVQENPLVCNQDGFHVMNGREAINLTTEANLVCQTDYLHDAVDKCPRRVERPARQPCCPSHDAKKKSSATKTVRTTTVNANSKIDAFTRAAASATTEKTTVAAAAAVASVTAAAAGASPTTTTESRAAMRARKLNMERFQRLQRRPVDGAAAPHLRAPVDSVVAARGVPVTSETTVAEAAKELPSPASNQIPSNDNNNNNNNIVKGERFLNSAKPTVTKTTFAKIKEPQESAEAAGGEAGSVKRGGRLSAAAVEFSHDDAQPQTIAKKDEQIVARRS